MVIPSFVSDDVHVNIRFPHRPHPLQFFVCIHDMTMRMGKFKVFCKEQYSHSAIEQVGERDEMAILRSPMQWLIGNNTFHREFNTLNYVDTIVCIQTEVHKRRQPRFFLLQKSFHRQTLDIHKCLHHFPTKNIPLPPTSISISYKPSSVTCSTTRTSSSHCPHHPLSSSTSAPAREHGQLTFPKNIPRLK